MILRNNCKAFIFFTMIAVTTVLLVGGCSKNNTGSEKSFLRFKSDGTLKEFADCNVIFLDTMVGISPTVYYCHITSGVNANWAALSIYTTNPLTENFNYTQEVNAVTGTPVGGIASKNDTDGEYISWQGGWPYYDVSITLTTVTPNYFKGKFTGKVRDLDGTVVHSITDGEFRADIH